MKGPCLFDYGRDEVQSQDITFDRIKSGFELYVLNTLVNVYNFTYTLVGKNREGWGSFVNGNWTGIVGMVDRGEADFAIGELSMTSSRFDAIDFTIPYNFETLTYMLTTEFAHVRHTFEIDSKDICWLMTSLVICVLTSCLVTIFRQLIQTNLLKINGTKFWRQVPTQTNPVKVSHHSSNRVIVLIWNIGKLLITGLGSGALLSILTDTRLVPIDSLSKLANIDYIRPMFKVSNTDIYVEAMRQSPNHYIKILMSHQAVLHNETSYHQVFKSMAGHPWALIEIGSLLRCGQMTLNQHSYYVPPPSDGSTFSNDLHAIGLQRKSELKPSFDHVMLQLVETGLTIWAKSQSELNVSNSKNYFTQDGDSSEDLTGNQLRQLVKVSQILIVGSFVSLVLLIIDMVKVKLGSEK